MIHHVQLAAPPGTEAALRGFYTGVLGFDEIGKPPALVSRGGAWFRGAGLGGAPIEIHVGVEAGFAPARKAHPGLLVDDIEGWAARLTAAEYPVTWDDGFPGMRRFYSEDVHGNRLEFLTPTP
jgi:catechol 2,3-dioxygenase-like lactoylglutathione lyase family enzyme